jgi:UDP-N-acetyl-D-mannosaminuronate dehydrogenase
MNNNKISGGPKKEGTIIVGLGEVGRPLLQLLADHYNVIGVDIKPPTDLPAVVDVLHICFPYEIKDFIGESARYIKLFKPTATVINSTVGVGTTRAIADRAGAPVVHSPVRGKHVRMLQELSKYTKFIGAADPAIGRYVAQHFEAAGMKTKVLPAPEATEIAKLTETTYFGLMIAWAQEVERYCDQVGQDYESVISFYDEISFFPSTKYFPGVIGGHCVMPNIEILRKFDDSPLLRAIQTSNRSKIDREERKKLSDQGVKATT